MGGNPTLQRTPHLKSCWLEASGSAGRQVPEEGVVLGLPRRHPRPRVRRQQAVQQPQAVPAELRAGRRPRARERREASGVPARERVRPVLQLRRSWPRRLGRRPAQLEDLEERADLRIPGEDCLADGHLGHAAPRGPHVDFGPVDRHPEEDLRGAVPERDDVVRVRPLRGRGEASEAEVADLEPRRADEDVRWLQVAVDHHAHVARVAAVEQLLRVVPHLLHGHPLTRIAEGLERVV
mmetsp:Transcript_103514/g.316915  ORF Transcript_103514/g.316915 Transcript_103514/m.316915 type:complete len:237 (+) Transcript_103514:116-826(+)